MADAAAFCDQLMDWLYDRAKGNSTKNVPITEFAEMVGLDLDGAYTLTRYCRDRGLLDDKRSGMGHPCGMLTAHGIADVLARRTRRADPAQRARACREGLLRWFYARHIAQAHMPATEEFDEDDSAMHEGIRFTLVEIHDAAKYLSDKGLIMGVTVAEATWPIQAQITREGLDCVTDWDGNVAQYLRDQRGYGPTYNGPYVQGDAPNANMVGQNSGTVNMNQNNQQIAPGFEPIAEAVAFVLTQLPAYGLAPADRQDVEEAAAGVLAEVRQDQPEPGRLRQAAAALKGFLFPIVTEAATEEGRELAQKGIEQITAAISSVL